MDDVLSGSTDCRPVAVIFARGTFDTGNTGVWVGGQLLEAVGAALTAANPSVTFAAQGVSASAYAADLGGYISDGGPEAAATSMATTATSYAAKCPGSAIVFSGWSQGALVTHKALAQLSDATLAQVAGVVTFGDPWHLFSSDALPSAIPSGSINSFCFTGAIIDPLCAPLPTGYPIPDTQSDITGPFDKLPSLAVGTQEAGAAATLVEEFPGQLAENWLAFVKDLTPSGFVKLLLTPEHFQYGNSGATTDAAAWIAGLPLVTAALA
ncbi:carbohydrate esterase family 5 protein [Athelia psychrophila]|uniref:cutinase n=1 Tax=Athelia psychrophila TaxID=1759441 RepID=A0A166KM19_9AGAM|nr:carbohydrate esterase family 5 protein [Fibularhizoctonia sp. CBS 109695]